MNAARARGRVEVKKEDGGVKKEDHVVKKEDLEVKDGRIKKEETDYHPSLHFGRRLGYGF